MKNPVIEIGDNQTVLTYQVTSLASLTRALQQVSDFLRNHGSGDKYLTLKSGTRVKIEPSMETSHNSRIQFYLPIELSRAELADI